LEKDRVCDKNARLLQSRLLRPFIGYMYTSKEAETFFAPPQVLCPDCGSAMRVFSVMPSPLGRGGEIVYRCDGCNVELKRVIGPDQ
jgi:hypothetical protein